MGINRDGSRSRRLGFSPETSYVSVDTGITEDATKELGRSQFRWAGPGGYSSEEFLVVQIGNYLAVHTLNTNSISSGKIYEKTFGASRYSVNFSYASVDGFLVVVTGRKDVLLLGYDGTNVTESTFRLKVRDFWGVAANPGGTDFSNPDSHQTRPSVIGNKYLYNLRNQTWALPRVRSQVDPPEVADPIQRFYSGSGDTEYPSYSDSLVPFVYPNTALSNKTVERFWAENSYLTKPSTTAAPKGYFIIDLLNRGASRLSQEAKLRSDNPELVLSVNTLPDDTTAGGATVAESYAGRVWYSGFSGELTDGDSQSPRLSSYVLFSQIVDSEVDVGKCYQQADPTSIEDPALVDTDGGYIKINGAHNIRRLVAIGTSLFVIADNGVWRISGADGNSFVATTYSVERLNNDGCVSAVSVVLSESAIFYWGSSSIYLVSRNASTGEWEVNDIAEDSVKSLFNSIDNDQKSFVSSYYDNVNNSVRWVYGENPLDQSQVNELIFSIRFGAFTRNLIKVSGSSVLGVSSVSGGQSVSLSDIVSNITVNSVEVTVNGDQVTLLTDPSSRSAERSYYCILLEKSPTILYTFGGYSDTTFTDWKGLGNIDSEAFINSGFITLGEPRTRKSVPYLTTFFERTEVTPAEGDNSSCILRSKWDWTDSYEAYKWSNPRQAYRPQRRDNGQTVVVTRNKIRGNGKSVAFRIESESNKNLHIYGWSMNVNANSEE